ncbi:MAG: AAA family ATPase [Deltaproteobacteria bacterium]|nr:AAA family ATPase [Deltaproteobacteria bacterium]
MLKTIHIQGFRSIKEATVELDSLNILIGQNGAGKSNFVAVFKMLNEMMGERLQEYIGKTGRAQSLLHFGPKTTPHLEARLEFTLGKVVDTYSMRLAHAAGDTLIFTEETLSFHTKGFRQPKTDSLGAGHLETGLRDRNRRDTPTIGVFRKILNSCRVYHFHDTSATAGVRQHCYVDDNRWLMPDGGNLAAMLLRLREEDGGKAYQRIGSTIRLIAPFFGDFVLEPAGLKRELLLNWRTKDSDQVFGPHQLSDGTLRAICLVTLLLQPEALLGGLLIVDEPELGLHPYALNIIASLFKKASHHSQILITTQSPTFLDHFDPEQIIVVDLAGKESKFTRPGPEHLAEWLKEYSLGEIWEKNVIGGGPH